MCGTPVPQLLGQVRRKEGNDGEGGICVSRSNKMHCQRPNSKRSREPTGLHPNVTRKRLALGLSSHGGCRVEWEAAETQPILICPYKAICREGRMEAEEEAEVVKEKCLKG